MFTSFCFTSLLVNALSFIGLWVSFVVIFYMSICCSFIFTNMLLDVPCRKGQRGHTFPEIWDVSLLRSSLLRLLVHVEISERLVVRIFFFTIWMEVQYYLLPLAWLLSLDSHDCCIFCGTVNSCSILFSGWHEYYPFTFWCAN